jgi:hypothetical protein
MGGIGQGTWLNGTLVNAGTPVQNGDVLDVLMILYVGDPEDGACGVCCGDWSGFIGNDFYAIAGDQVWGEGEIPCCTHYEEVWHTYVVDQADAVPHPQLPGHFIATGHSIGGAGLQQYGEPCLLDVDHDWSVGVNELLYLLQISADVDEILSLLDSWGPCIPEHRWMTSCIGSGAGFVRQWFPLLED